MKVYTFLAGSQKVKVTAKSQEIATAAITSVGARRAISLLDDTPTEQTKDLLKTGQYMKKKDNKALLRISEFFKANNPEIKAALATLEKVQNAIK